MSNKIVTVVVIVAATVLSLGSTYYLGQKAGKASVQSSWDTAKLAQANEVTRLKGIITKNEETHREESGRINQALVDANTRHNDAIAAAQRVFDQRLRDSQARGGVYQRLANGTAAERDRLASHAAQLDRTLEEGRHLVRDLRVALGQREDQLRALGEQILTDRKLFSNAGNANGKQDAATVQ